MSLHALACAHGSLYPFNQGTNVLPKALMPVGNVPIVNIVLDWVFDAGLTDVLILVPPESEAAISEHLQLEYSSNSRLHITLKNYTDGEEDEEEDDNEKIGTARLLKQFRGFIKVRRSHAGMLISVRLCFASLRSVFPV